MKKRLVPILLSLVMVLMLLSSPALAVNGEGASIMFLPPAAPATDKLSEVLSGEVVQLACANGTHSHAPASYPLKPDTYSVGMVTADDAYGYICPVIIQANAYIAAYNDETASKHSLSPHASEAQTLMLTWDAAAKSWKAPKNKLPLAFSLTCQDPRPSDPTPRISNVPSVPTDSQLLGILGQSIAKVACANSQAFHGDKTYGLLPGGYTISAVAGDATIGYSCTVSINSAPYVAAYNTEMGAIHALQTDGQTPKAITLTWDGKAWQKPITGLPITLTVSCQKQPVSTLPTAPTKAETLQLLGAARVQVNCSAGRHGARAYVLREDSIQLSSVYEVNNQPRVNVTLSGAPYVQSYSWETGKAHALSSPTAYTITLVYQNGWRLQEPLAAAKTYAFNAACNQGNVGGGWYPRISGGRNPGGNAPITQPGTVASFPNPALSIPRTGDAPQMGLGAGLAVLALLGLAMYFGRRASAD